MEKEKCITGDCIKYSIINIKSLQTIPFEGKNTSIEKLFSFFLYLAPGIESAYSKGIPIEKHNEVFERMMFNRHFRYMKFCSSNAKIESELSKGFLYDNNLCLKCKRFVCKKKKSNKEAPLETHLDCFLRHIRNAIAHGRVYINHIGNKVHIIFEDENNSKNISARIICIKADLEYWKSILSDSKYYSNF